MSLATDFIEIQDISGEQQFVQKTHIVKFYLNKLDDIGYVTTVLGDEHKLMLDRAEYEKFCQKMKVHKTPNPMVEADKKRINPPNVV